MSEKEEQSNLAREKTQRMLAEAERERSRIRFQRGLQDLLEGRPEILKNREFYQNFSENISFLASGSERHKVTGVVESLVENAGNARYQEGVQAVLAAVCDYSLATYNIPLLQLLSARLSELLAVRDCNFPVNVNLRGWLVKTCCIFVRSSLWQDYRQLMSTLWKVRNRAFPTEEGEGYPFRTLFREIGTKDVVEKLLRRHLTADSDGFIGKSIRYLGDEAILYLLNRLVFSKDKEERFQLLALLADYGEGIVKMVHTYLEEDLPWYAVRNLVLLVGEIGNPEYYTLIEGYLIHPEKRVQEQVVSSIVKLGGQDMERRLVLALPVVEDSLKLKIAIQLGNFSSEETANGILGIIRRRADYSASIRPQLLQNLSFSLRSYPYPQVVEGLIAVRDSGVDENAAGLGAIIDESIKRLRSIIRHREKEERADRDLLSFDVDPVADQDDFAGIDGFLEEIDDFVAQGKVETASQRLFKKVSELARQKDFHSAELLRDRLLEINPDALQDVIRAAEIIEEEKNNPSSAIQVEVWQELFTQLNEKEYEFLVGALRSENYAGEEKIVSTGEIDPCLYFVNSGVIRLSCVYGRRETFLKRLKPGDIVGVNPFFNASVWTVSIAAQQNCKLLVLRRDLFAGHEQHPRLEEKLLAFCRSKNTIPSLVRMSGQDRRSDARYAVNVTLSNILLDPYGNREGRRVFQGEMLDISCGGLAFAIRIAKRENAQLLLGRQIISEIQLGGEEKLRCFGTIVGVNFQNDILKEYSVHVKFYRDLEQARISDVLNLVL